LGRLIPSALNDKNLRSTTNRTPPHRFWKSTVRRALHSLIERPVQERFVMAVVTRRIEFPALSTGAVGRRSRAWRPAVLRIAPSNRNDLCRDKHVSKLFFQFTYGGNVVVRSNRRRPYQNKPDFLFLEPRRRPSSEKSAGPPLDRPGPNVFFLPPAALNRRRSKPAGTPLFQWPCGPPPPRKKCRANRRRARQKHHRETVCLTAVYIRAKLEGKLQTYDTDRNNRIREMERGPMSISSWVHLLGAAFLSCPLFSAVGGWLCCFLASARNPSR